MYPQTIRDMATVIGWPATESFLRAFGGKRVYIPKKLQSPWAAIIAEVIGDDATGKLIAWSGDAALNVPACRTMSNHLRNLDIVRDYTAGKSINDLVDLYGLTYRQLQNILKTTDTTVDPATGSVSLSVQRALEF